MPAVLKQSLLLLSQVLAEHVTWDIQDGIVPSLPVPHCHKVFAKSASDDIATSHAPPSQSDGVLQGTQKRFILTEKVLGEGSNGIVVR